LTAKIKYKFGRALQRWSEFSTDERIITICAISLFLPYYLVAVPGLFAVFRALLVPEIRHRMTAVSASGYIYASFPIFTFPAVIFYNWFGLLGGAVLWLMLVFMLYLFTVMRVRFYNNIIDLILLLSMVALAVAVSAKILYSCSGIAVYHFMFDSNGALLHSMPHDMSGVLFFLFDSNRTASVFWNPNYYGYMLEIFVILALYRFEKRHSPWYLIILFANLGSILLCDCRTAWAALGAALLIYVIHYKRNVKWVVFTMLITVVVVILILLVPMFSGRLATNIINYDVDKRSKIWGDAIHWILHRPVFGYGMDGFRRICILTGAKKIRWHSHNIILNIMLDFGVVGLAYFSCMIGKIISVLNKPQFCVIYSQIRNMIMIAGLATMIHGVTDVPILGVQTALMLIFVVSGCSVERNERVFKRLSNFCEIYEKA
jgi:Lipid A core - O-antigen ligase and related enzymes